MEGKSTSMLEDMRRQTMQERREMQLQLQQQSPRSISFFAQFCLTRPKGDPRYDEIERHWDDYFVVIPQERSIEDYIEIGDRVGSGSFGSVYECTRMQSELSAYAKGRAEDEGRSKKPAKFWTCSAPDDVSCDAYEFDPARQEQGLCVKVIEKSSGNTLRARFGSKLLIAALAAKHPNITKYIQFLEDSHRMYIVMELYTGPDLFDYIISNRPVTEEKAAFILEQISRATNFLHTQGGMHRDLKPENFMFENDTPGAALKLVDFGSATSRNPYDARTPMPMGSALEKQIMAEEEERKQLEGESTELSQPAKRIGTGSSSVVSTDTLHPRRSMSVVGTTGYCGPEVFTGCYDEKCDIFSAGVILFVMLTGEMPFECKNVDQYKGSLHRAQKCGLDKVLCEYRGDRCANMSPEAKDLVFKMLELDPKKRLSARDVLEHPFIKENQRKREIEENTAVENPPEPQAASTARENVDSSPNVKPMSTSLNSSDVAPVRKEGPTFPSRNPDQWYLGGFFSSIFKKLDSGSSNRRKTSDNRK